MRRLLWFFTLGILVLAPQFIGGEATGYAQTRLVMDLLEDMSPEERVGQLFIVTFDGNEIDTDDPVYTIIQDHHISGVLLEAKNDNYEEGPESLQDIRNRREDCVSKRFIACYGCSPAASGLLNSSTNLTLVIFGKNFCISMEMPLFASCKPSI